MTTFLYNPDRKGKELLVAEFVVRTQVYNNIMHDLETTSMKHPEQHYLLVGQRGTGKTTLLNRIKYGIEDSKKLSSWLVPILFTEEQYHISELANLWESVAQHLEDYHGFEGVCKEVETHLSKHNFEELAFDVLEKHLAKHQKKLVLLIDNIGDLLKKLDKTEVHRLREILQTKNQIRLIAGSPFYLESILDYQQPLFEFFKVIRLEGLSQQETITLLRKLGEINDKKDEIEKIITETPERITTLRTLTGGVPRTIVLMFTVFIDYNDEGSVKDLERILDAVTPLYKHRMDDLPTQQQKIIDAVAKNWDAISVKELKEQVRLESKVISAQLRQLEKAQVIEKRETGTKNHLYFIKERFFNIWYLMRYGRKDDRQKVIWLVRFLESWCSSGELEFRIHDDVNKIKSGEMDEQTKELYGQVYAAIDNLGAGVKIQLKKAAPESVAKRITISEEDVYVLMEKHILKEDWDYILNTVSDVYFPSYRAKALIFGAIVHQTFSAENKKISLVEGIINKSKLNRTKTDQNEPLYHFSELEADIFKSILTISILNSTFNNENNEVLKSINTFFRFIKKQDFNQTTFEYYLLTQLFKANLAYNNYNIIFKIFSDLDDYNLKEIFKPIYYALIKLKEGEESIEFLKAGPELKEIIEEVIEEIYTHRNNQKELLDSNK